MTPKQKSIELVDKMSGIGDEHHHCTDYVAKQCALIAVDEILTLGRNLDEFRDEYWYEVIKEIKSL